MARPRGWVANRGFTLVELLVVIAVMVGVMAMGTLAMGDFFSQGNFRLGVRGVVNALHAARQTAIGERKWVFAEFVDTATDIDSTNDGLPDYIELYMLKPATSVEGTLTYKREVTDKPFERIDMPRNIELADIPAKAGATWSKWGLDGCSGALFFPDGSCLPTDQDSKFIIMVLDAFSRDKAKIFVYTVTGFQRVKYELRG